MKVGRIIKRLRKEKKMTLQELSDQSGVALATLSRIENEHMTGTIESHLEVCKVLEVTLPELYSEIEEGKKVVEVQPQAARSEVFVHNKKSSSEILTSDVLSKKMMPIMINLEKSGHTHKEETRRGTERFIYVLEGRAEVTINKEKYNLVKGDTLYFDSSLPHIFKNTGASEARIISVTTPPAL